jgi:hypothetical protein
MKGTNYKVPQRAQALFTVIKPNITSLTYLNPLTCHPAQYCFLLISFNTIVFNFRLGFSCININVTGSPTKAM